jgi:hypothetical protein
MGARVLFNIPSTGAGDAQRRIDSLEQTVGNVAEVAEAAFDTGGKWVVKKVSTAAVLQPWDFVLANPTTAGFPLILPDPSATKLAQIRIKNDSASTNAVTIKAADGSKIDGAATFTMNTARLAKLFVSDGVEWKPV